jgi:hypothetical protein
MFPFCFELSVIDLGRSCGRHHYLTPQRLHELPFHDRLLYQNVYLMTKLKLSICLMKHSRQEGVWRSGLKAPPFLMSLGRRKRSTSWRAGWVSRAVWALLTRETWLFSARNRTPAVRNADCPYHQTVSADKTSVMNVLTFPRNIRRPISSRSVAVR